MKGRKESVFSEFLLSPNLGSGSVKGGQFQSEYACNNDSNMRINDGC